MSNTGHPAWQLAHLVGSKPPAFGINLEAGLYAICHEEPELIEFCSNLENDSLLLKKLRDHYLKNKDNILFCTDLLISGRSSSPQFFMPSLAVTSWKAGRIRDETLRIASNLWPGHKLYTYYAGDHYQLYIDVIADYSRERSDWIDAIDCVADGGVAHPGWLSVQRNYYKSLLDWNCNPKLKEWITL